MAFSFWNVLSVVSGLSRARPSPELRLPEAQVRELRGGRARVNAGAELKQISESANQRRAGVQETAEFVLPCLG